MPKYRLDELHVAGTIDADGHVARDDTCLLYTSDAADERSSVDLGGRRIMKKKNGFTGGIRSGRQADTD